MNDDEMTVKICDVVLNENDHLMRVTQVEALYGGRDFHPNTSLIAGLRLNILEFVEFELGATALKRIRENHEPKRGCRE